MRRKITAMVAKTETKKPKKTTYKQQQQQQRGGNKSQNRLVMQMKANSS